ncbi:MAG: methenyltetrahydromethanopterin cyclohydrolase [Planctomycetota bacterium]
MFSEVNLNKRAWRVAADLRARAKFDHVDEHRIGGAVVLDAGVKTSGSLAAGRALALACIADLGTVSSSLERLGDRPLVKVTVEVDVPHVSCLLSQYAGWRVAVGKFFAMGSGPIRVLVGKESLFEEFHCRQVSDVGVGILETSKLPDEAVIAEISREAGLPPESLLLLAARTASIAGSYQVVARAVETCLHKLHELKFDVTTIKSAIGSAFLPPIPNDDLVAIGRTNDSILYGGEVILYVDGEDESIREVGPRVPASSSPDHGAPFADIFQRYDRDFYKIDPLLFSPAVVQFQNLRTGNLFSFGKMAEGVLLRSFFGQS